MYSFIESAACDILRYNVMIYFFSPDSGLCRHSATTDFVFYYSRTAHNTIIPPEYLKLLLSKYRPDRTHNDSHCLLLYKRTSIECEYRPNMFTPIWYETIVRLRVVGLSPKQRNDFNQRFYESVLWTTHRL